MSQLTLSGIEISISLLKKLKALAYILIFILAFLTIQPVFSAGFEQAAKKECCTKNKTCSNPEKNAFDQAACNPLRACVYASYFVVVSASTDNPSPVDAIQKLAAVNDNRTASRLSECWHPPRIA